MVITVFASHEARNHCLVNDLDAHAAGSTLDHAGSSLDISSVEVFHLALSNLLCLGTGQLGNLVLVRFTGSLVELSSLLQKNSSRRSLGDEREGSILKNRDFNRNDETSLIFGSFVEFLQNPMMLTPA